MGEFIAGHALQVETPYLTACSWTPKPDSFLRSKLISASARNEVCNCFEQKLNLHPLNAYTEIEAFAKFAWWSVHIVYTRIYFNAGTVRDSSVWPCSLALSFPSSTTLFTSQGATSARCHTAIVGFAFPRAWRIREEEARIAGFALDFSELAHKT